MKSFMEIGVSSRLLVLFHVLHLISILSPSTGHKIEKYTSIQIESILVGHETTLLTPLAPI